MKNKIIIGVLALSLVCAITYIGYDKFFAEDTNPKTEMNGGNNTETEKNEENQNIEKNLDVNSVIVQNLYNKVVGGDGAYKYWMYGYNPPKDFIISEIEEDKKMNFISMNANEEKRQVVECSKDITPQLSGESHSSACYLNEKYGNQSENNYVEYGYTREYIESLYKDLFGANAKLDTAVDIQDGLSRYHYIKSLDMYVIYMTEGGETTDEYYTGKVVKAMENNTELKIYEEVTLKSEVDQKEIAKYNYVYTFKKEKDGLYSFYSRVEEK